MKIKLYIQRGWQKTIHLLQEKTFIYENDIELWVFRETIEIGDFGEFSFKNKEFQKSKMSRENSQTSRSIVLLSSDLSVYDSPIVANTFIRKSTLTIVLVVLSSSNDDLEL